MRRTFATVLQETMERDPCVWLLTGGVGYGVLDELLTTYPDRCINCEAAEQAMVDMAVGLALSGQKPFVYAITPHLYRAFEGIRLYLHHERIPVRLVGIGRDREYGDLGYTHWADDTRTLFGSVLTGIHTYWPDKKDEVRQMVEAMIRKDEPSFISLSRT